MIGGTNADDLTVGYANKNGTSMALARIRGLMPAPLSLTPSIT